MTTMAAPAAAAAERFRFVPVVCPTCKANAPRTLGFRGGQAHRSGLGLRSPVVQCRLCSHIYANPMPIVEDPNAVYHDAGEYFTHHSADEKVRRFTRLLQQLERRLGRRGRLLDVGSGRGELLAAAARLGWDAQGVEASQEFAAHAAATYGVRVRTGSLESAGLAEASCDVVTMAAVVEHFYDPAAVLREAHRVLAPGGLIWIDTANEASLYHQLGNLYFRLQRRDWVTQLSPTFTPYHVQGFTTRSLRAVVERAGFRVETLRTHYGTVLLPHAGWRQGLEYAAAWGVSRVSVWLQMASFMELVGRRVP